MSLDENSLVIASMAEKFHLPHSVIAVEVITTTKALKFASNIGLSSIILEVDSKSTIEALKCEVVSLAAYGHLIEEAKSLARAFTNVEFSHTRRQGNSTTQNIARHARHVSEFSVWMKDVPSHLLDVISADSAIS